MHPSKRKGDRAELEVQGILRDLLGVPARRKLGAGRRDDMGDMDGVPDTCVSVTAERDWAKVVAKLGELEQQRERGGSTFSVLFARRPGGRIVVLLDPEMWATYAREVMT